MTGEGSAHDDLTEQAASANREANEPYIDFDNERPEVTPPPAETISWVEAELRCEVTAVEQLFGGRSSAVHRLTLTDDPGHAVIRRYTATEWLAREPHIPDEEARTLRLLGQLDIGTETPTLLAADPSGRRCDRPTIVMSEVPGRPDISPVDPALWAERLASCLAGIHQAPVRPGLGRYRRWDHPDSPIPEWATQPELWTEAKAWVSGALPDDKPRFLHRDFHPNNVHWNGGEIVAVVDWLGACIGPVACDVAHCRWNLAVLADIETAERFTAHYRRLTGWDAPVEDLVTYDLATVLSGPTGPFPTDAWNDLGRPDITAETVGGAVEAWLAHVMAFHPDAGAT